MPGPSVPNFSDTIEKSKTVQESEELILKKAMKDPVLRAKMMDLVNAHNNEIASKPPIEKLPPNVKGSTLAAEFYFCPGSQKGRPSGSNKSK